MRWWFSDEGADPALVYAYMHVRRASVKLETSWAEIPNPCSTNPQMIVLSLLQRTETNL